MMNLLAQSGPKKQQARQLNAIHGQLVEQQLLFDVGSLLHLKTNSRTLTNYKMEEICREIFLKNIKKTHKYDWILITCFYYVEKHWQ